MSSKQDDVEFINRILREAGHAAHCRWIKQLDKLGDAVKQFDPQLIWLFCDNFQFDISAVTEAKTPIAATLPLIAVRKKFSEEDAAAAMGAGAHDLISGTNKDHVRAVAERELRAFHLERALTNSLRAAKQYKQQLQSFMAGSVDAIAYASDGILVDANQAWGKLFGRAIEDMNGPVMDLFDASSQAAIKGALVAAAQGQWIGEELKVTGRPADGSKLPLSLQLEASMFDGEPAVKLSVPRKSQQKQAPEELMQRAISSDPETGIYHRRQLVDLLRERLKSRPSRGVRALAFIRPDRFGSITEEVGPFASEELLVQVAETIRELARPSDLYGRFGGNVFVVWVERGTLRDVEAWANTLVSKIAGSMFEVGGRTVSLTCTVGLADIGPHTDNLEDLIKGAQRASQRGRQRGGNQTVLEETSDESTRIQRFDEVWVQQLRSALVENRFRLARHPIASLTAPPLSLFDTGVTMIDQQGEEVAPSIFLPVAARNNLMRAVDRWIIATAMNMSKGANLDCLFVKLSSASIADADLMRWLTQRAASTAADPRRICLQIAEQTASQHLRQTIDVAQQLQSTGFSVAIEHFGLCRDPERFLTQIPMRYVKIDGSLMQGLAQNEAHQAKIADYVSIAARQEVLTIAERVEDANTMAILFQLGVGYVQGHYIHEPEVVLEDVV